MTEKTKPRRANRPAKPSPQNGVEIALRALDRPGHRGTHMQLAKLLGLSRGAVSLWCGVIPPLRVNDVARVTGVSRELLRPDLFGPPPTVSRRKAA